MLLRHQLIQNGSSLCGKRMLISSVAENIVHPRQPDRGGLPSSGLSRR